MSNPPPITSRVLVNEDHIFPTPSCDTDGMAGRLLLANLLGLGLLASLRTASSLSPPPVAKATGVLRVGGAASFTGPYDSSFAAAKGYQLWANRTNLAGGWPINDRNGDTYLLKVMSAG